MSLSLSSSVEWWERVVVVPMRRVWLVVSTRLGIRRTGLRKLRKEVRTCEYEDVHVMWEMLSKTNSGIGAGTGRHGYYFCEELAVRSNKMKAGERVWTVVVTPFKLC